MGSWFMGLFMALVSLLGLKLASGAYDPTMAWVGVFFFLFGVLFCYAMIVRNTGHSSH